MVEGAREGSGRRDGFDMLCGPLEEEVAFLKRKRELVSKVVFCGKGELRLR